MNGSVNILVVDDNLNNLRVLIGILKTADYHIRPALSGEIALLALESFIPDLILLDINMPGINGYDTCKQLKANERTRDIPVIFISAMRDVDDKLAAFQAGAVDYVTKPFQIEEVLARVKTHLELNRARQEVKTLLKTRTLELSQNEIRHRNMIEMLEIGIVQHLPSDEIVFVNQSALNLLGLTEAQLRDKTMYDPMWSVIHEDGSPFVGAMYPSKIAIATAQPVRDVVMGVNRPATQDRVWLLVNAIPELDDMDRVMNVVCTFNDISERTFIKERLLANQLRLSKLIESAMDAIITLDESLNVVLMNPAAAILFGMAGDEALGFHIDRLMPERYRQAHADYLYYVGSESAASPANGLRQFTALRADGEEFPVEASISHVAVNGARQYTIIMRDISERRRIESALKSSLNEKVSLLNEVHHRVKNNLQVITSLLRLEAGRNIEPQTKAVLNDMQGRIRSMALLHESLYRTGTFASIDLGAYIADLATQGFRAQKGGGGVVRLHLDLASVPVSMDQAMPCGLLINELISNCLKHGFAGGRSGAVSVSLSTMADGRQVRIGVSDTGRGLPDDFETRRGQSLGLQLVADLVSQLGGKLEISNASGAESGAQFDICFEIDMIKLQASNVA